MLLYHLRHKYWSRESNRMTPSTPTWILPALICFGKIWLKKQYLRCREANATLHFWWCVASSLGITRTERSLVCGWTLSSEHSPTPRCQEVVSSDWITLIVEREVITTSIGCFKKNRKVDSCLENDLTNYSIMIYIPQMKLPLFDFLLV